MHVYASHNHCTSIWHRGPGFTISPQDVIQAEGTLATFQCQYSSATTVGWIFNGTSIYSYNPPNITTSILPGSVNVLTVLALPAYNETEVWCVATILQNGMSGRVEYSSKGKLVIQGILHFLINHFSANGTVARCTRGH